MRSTETTSARSELPSRFDAGEKTWATTDAVRNGWWIIALCIALCTVAAGIYVGVAPKHYRSSADLLVTPVSRDDPNYVGLTVIRDSSDPTRDVETLARLVDNVVVARRAEKALRRADDPEAFLRTIRVTPVAQSNVVTVEATGHTPADATAVANAFARAAVAERSQELRRQVKALIVRLRRHAGRRSTVVNARIQALGVIAASGDPTVHLATLATPPAGAYAPRPLLSVLAAAAIGLVIGFGAALALQFADTRISREEEIDWGFPVLLRAPLERRLRRQPLLPKDLPVATLDRFRLLSRLVAAKAGGRPATIAITSPGFSEGKTTTAINLAAALGSGSIVTLVEGSEHRPKFQHALGLEAPQRRFPSAGTDLGLTLATRHDLLGGQISAYFRPADSPKASGVTDERVNALVHEASSDNDYVVIDAPSAANIADQFAWLQQATCVVIVARLGRTRGRDLRELLDACVLHGVRPLGLVVFGGRAHRSGL